MCALSRSLSCRVANLHPRGALPSWIRRVEDTCTWRRRGTSNTGIEIYMCVCVCVNFQYVKIESVGWVRLRDYEDEAIHTLHEIFSSQYGQEPKSVL